MRMDPLIPTMLVLIDMQVAPIIPTMVTVPLMVMVPRIITVLPMVTVPPIITVPLMLTDRDIITVLTTTDIHLTNLIQPTDTDTKLTSTDSPNTT